MNVTPPRPRLLLIAEYVVAGLLTVGAIWLHARALVSGGPLWRDEISSVQLAAMPTLTEFLRWLVFDLFPIFYFGVLRSWIAIGFGQTDFQLRLFAGLTGVLVVASMWLAVRLIHPRRGAPLWPLALVAVSPLAIHEGDALRAYGFAMLFIVVTTGLLGRYIEDQRPTTLLLAAIAAVVSVQTVYINALMVFAACVGASLALMRTGDRRSAILALFAGVPAALSLLPYAPFFRGAYAMREMQRTDAGLLRVGMSGLNALTGQNPVLACIWLGVPIAIAIFFFIPGWRQRHSGYTAAGSRILFGLVTLTVALAGTVAFLWWSGWLAARYFLPFAAVAALCFHVMTVEWDTQRFVRLANLIVATLSAALLLPSAYAAAGVRRTNCDLVAAQVAKRVNEQDMIVVTAFTFGISFERYYHGAAPWRTIPDIPDHKLHRWDLALNVMSVNDPMRETMASLEAVLKAGHKVFLVGALPVPEADPPEPLPAKAPDAAQWESYEENWRKQVAYFIDRHAVNGEEISAGETQPINRLEDLGAFVVSGWRE